MGLSQFNFSILHKDHRSGPHSRGAERMRPPTPIGGMLDISLLPPFVTQPRPSGSPTRERMLVVEVRSEGHGRGVPTHSRRVRPMSLAIACRRSQARRFGPAVCAWPHQNAATRRCPGTS